MKKLTESKWHTEVDKYQGVIKVKADDGARTPICMISTPAGADWMQNTMWLNNALKKAELITMLPELLEAASKLIEQELKVGYMSQNQLHDLRVNAAFINLRQLVDKIKLS